MRGRILIVDDEQVTGTLLAEVLQQHGYAAHAVSSAHACLEQVERDGADVVLTDVMMPGMSGIELCQVLRERHGDVVPIVLTAACMPDVAVAAIRAGAYDYLTKPVSIRALEVSVARALEQLALRHELDRLRETAFSTELVGTSAEFQRALQLAHRIADTDATVLVCGESGTGKEVIAREIHRRSSRRDEPFVA